MKNVYCLCFLAFIGIGVRGQTTVTGSFSHGGNVRNYRVYVPAGYTGAVAVPLVFNLHGYGSNASQQELYSGMNAVADTANFLVCYPDGVSNSWNSGFTIPYNGGVDDVGFISRLIDTLRADYNIDPARVYSCGMSNGGFMSYRLACDLDERIAAVASVTGSMTSLQMANCTAARPVPVFEIHGDADAIVPYQGDGFVQSIDSVMGFWRARNNCPGPVVHDTLPDVVNEGSTVSVQHNVACQGGTEVLHYKVANGGHTWPGAFPIPSFGVTNQDIKASVEIWRFFYRFVHPAPILTGAQAPERLHLVIGPNPCRDKFVLHGFPGMEVAVYDLQGRTVYQNHLSTESLEVATAAWAEGIYMVRAQGRELTWEGKVLVMP